MVTHSEGSAYGAGVAQYLLDAGYKVTTILHHSSDEGDEFSTPKTPYTLQLSYEGDWVTGNKTIKNVDKVGEIKKETYLGTQCMEQQKIKIYLMLQKILKK